MDSIGNKIGINEDSRANDAAHDGHRRAEQAELPRQAAARLRVFAGILGACHLHGFGELIKSPAWFLVKGALYHRPASRRNSTDGNLIDYLDASCQKSIGCIIEVV